MMAVGRPSTKIAAGGGPVDDGASDVALRRGRLPLSPTPATVDAPRTERCPAGRGRSRRATTRRSQGRRPADRSRLHVRRRRRHRRQRAGPPDRRPGLGAAWDAAAPTGQFAGGLRRPLDDRRDLVERDGEHVVQYECQSLGRRQGVQNHEQRQSHRFGEHRLMLWIRFADTVDDRVWHPGDEFFRRTGLAAAQGVEADPRHHRGEPRGKVGDLRGIPAARLPHSRAARPPARRPRRHRLSPACGRPPHAGAVGPPGSVLPGPRARSPSIGVR